MADYDIARTDPEAAAKLPASLAANGFAFVRGAVPRGAALQMQKQAEAALQRMPDARLDKFTYARRQNYASSILEFFDEFPIDWQKLLNMVFAPPLLAAFESQLGPDFRIALQHSRLRYKNTADRAQLHPWHQEGAIGYSRDTMINVWLALNACGTAAPGLQLVKRGGLPLSRDLEISEEEIAATFAPEEIVTFVAEPGDAVLFMSNCLHRTQPDEHLTEPRYSIELRTLGREKTGRKFAGTLYIGQHDLARGHMQPRLFEQPKPQERHGQRQLAIGHSHLEALRLAAEAASRRDVDFVNLADPNRQGFFVSDGKGGVMLARAEADWIMENGYAAILCALRGNAHAKLGLLNHPRRFDFVLPDEPDLPYDCRAELVPYALMRQAMLREMAQQRLMLKALRKAVATPLVLLGVPPPVPSEDHIRRHPSWFKDKIGQAGISPLWLRYKLWRLQTQLAEETAAKLGIEVLPSPPEAADSQGMLREECWNADPTHGNAAYGDLVWRRIDRRAALLSFQAA